MLVARFEDDSYLGRAHGEWSDIGWSLDWGSEVIHKLILPHIEEKDRVLDVCCAFGRASYGFALKGANVDLVDKDEERLEIAIESLKALNTSPHGFCIDANELSLMLPSRYKAVIMLEATVHMLKSEAVRVIKQACEKVDIGGFLYVDGPSSLDYHYERYKSQEYDSPEEGTYLDACGCSGAMMIEPFTFFHPGELAGLVAGSGLEILDYQSGYQEHQTLKSYVVARKK